jgi:hypothetical protein
MDARAVILQAHRVAHYYNMVVLGYKGCETTQVYLGVLDTTTWSDSQEFQDNVAAIKDLVTHRVWLARELAMVRSHSHSRLLLSTRPLRQCTRQ